jgi:hypothetical protein
MQTPGFRHEQRGVAWGMGSAALLAIVSLSAALLLSPADADQLLPLADRLQLALTCDLFVVVWLAIAIGNVARLRFFSEQDIAGIALTEQTQRVRIASAILQNTLEQVALAVPVHLALACLVDGFSYVYPVLAGLFCLGRALFWVGYEHGARARAFGFALTFYPSLAALLIAICASVGLLF